MVAPWLVLIAVPLTTPPADSAARFVAGEVCDVRLELPAMDVVMAKTEEACPERCSEALATCACHSVAFPRYQSSTDHSLILWFGVSDPRGEEATTPRLIRFLPGVNDLEAVRRMGDVIHHFDAGWTRDGRVPADAYKVTQYPTFTLVELTTEWTTRAPGEPPTFFLLPRRMAKRCRGAFMVSPERWESIDWKKVVVSRRSSKSSAMKVSKASHLFWLYGKGPDLPE